MSSTGEGALVSGWRCYSRGRCHTDAYDTGGWHAGDYRVGVATGRVLNHRR
jgi:hypothetical protein